MDTSSIATPATPLKKMPAEVFVKIRKGEMEVKGTAWEEYVKFEKNYDWDKEKSLIVSGVEVVANINIVENDAPLFHLVLRKCCFSMLHFNNAKLKSFRIYSSKIGLFDIVNSTTDEISIELSTTGQFRISNSWMPKIDVVFSNLPKMEITDGMIRLFRCRCPLQNSVHLVFKKSKFEHLDFQDTVFTEFTTASISNCEANRLNFHNTCNYGTVFFSNLKPLNWEEINQFPEEKRGIFSEAGEEVQPSTLNFVDSDVGIMQFINCDLREFERFEFSNAKMLDVFVAGSQMPDDNAFCLPDNEKNPLKISEQKRLAYGQFKKIYEARGDIAGSLPYLAYEMEAYRQQLQMEGWWKNRGELAMLWMNRLSTNYGVSWQRGLAATIFITTFFYSVFCYLIGYRFALRAPDGINEFWKVVSYAPYYLNPLRDLDSVFLLPDKDFTPAARIWDFISRIFVAYFVYQTIQAFRKLGKSSG